MDGQVTLNFDLNLRHLRALSAITLHGSMNAAAQAVNLSQPALTQGLAKLERQLGIALFDRHPDGVSPTEAGILMAERVTIAFDHLTAATRGALRRGGRGFARPEQLMTASQLHAFLALADAGSFVGAAGATGLSQPALHRAVRDLEQICGVALAERRGRGVVLTAAGRRLARGVRLAAREIDAGIAELAGEQESGRIAIGAMPLSRALVLPGAIAAFTKGTPRAVVDVAEGSWRELVEPLRDGVIDLMIGALRDETPHGLEQRPLFTDRLVVIGRAGHPLTRVAAPTLDDLSRFGWIVGQADTPLRGHWEALFAGRQAPPAPIECVSVMVICGVLRDSDLLTLLSPDQVALEVQSGILATIGRPLEHGVRTIGITTRIRWRPTAAQRRFVDLLESAGTRNQNSGKQISGPAIGLAGAGAPLLSRRPWTPNSPLSASGKRAPPLRAARRHAAMTARPTCPKAARTRSMTLRARVFAAAPRAAAALADATAILSLVTADQALAAAEAGATLIGTRRPLVRHEQRRAGHQAPPPPGRSRRPAAAMSTSR